MRLLIDSHNHAGYVDKDAAAVVRDMDELGIAVTWLLTWFLPPRDDMPGYHAKTSPLHLRPDGTHAAIPLDTVLHARRKFPGRFIAGYCPDPLAGSAAELFEAAYRTHGVRVCGEFSYRMGMDDPRAIELFRCAGRLRCPVVLHIDVPFLPSASGGAARYTGGWVAGDVSNLERALAACPETIFVGHAPGFWREISGDAARRPEAFPDGPVTPGGRVDELMTRYPNLWADLSAGSGLNALRRDPAFTREFILRWSDRLLYGRDSFSRELLPFLESLALPADVMDKLTSGNATRLVPLSAARA